jgi:predicted small metal-binding protein
MDKQQLSCKDMGWNCEVSVCADTREEAIQKMGGHIQSTHALQGFSKDFYDRALSAVRAGQCESKDSPDESLCGACFGTCTC